MRGGRTKLAHLTAPQADYHHDEKGDALHAMELALSLEKLNFHKLRELHDIADATNDAQMADFVETMLADQVCFQEHQHEPFHPILHSRPAQPLKPKGFCMHFIKHDGVSC